MDDPVSGRTRASEEEYCQKKDRELIEQVGVPDPELGRELAEMGFTPETVKLLPSIQVQDESGGRFDVTPDDIIKYCEAVADASGGLFWIRRVWSEERATLGRIAIEVKSWQK